MSRKRIAALGLVVAMLGACGGNDPPEHVSLGPTEACLEAAGVPVSRKDLDFVASTALGGGLRARPDANSVTIAFGESADDALRIEQAYQQFSGPDIPLHDLLSRDRNAVLLWEEPPSEEQRNLVTGCLAGDG